ncbi:hypothetical protein D3C78_1057440 [compost metagenome]
MAILAGVSLGQSRQQNRPQRHAQHAGWQLHQTVGVVHPGHGTCDQERSENRIDDQRDLAHRYPENRRQHLLHHPPDAAVAQIQARQHQHADLFQVRQLVEQLRQPAHQNRPAERHYGRIEVRCQEQRKNNHADVEQRRHECRDRKTVPGVEDRTRQRRQGNQQYVRKGHPQQVGSELEFFRGIGETRRRHPDDPGCGQHAQHRDQRQHQRQQARDVGDKCAGRLFTLLAFVFGKNRHECLGKRPLGKDPPQQIGQFEGDKEGVGRHSRAKCARNEGVTNKPQNPGKHRDRADGGQRFEQIH